MSCVKTQEIERMLEDGRIDLDVPKKTRTLCLYLCLYLAGDTGVFCAKPVIVGKKKINVISNT